MTVPDDGLLEIRGRNTVAHTGLMNKDGVDYDVDRDVRRTRIIRALLAGMILRHVGYEGPLNGWHLDEQGWPLRADWFLVAERAQRGAKQRYEATAEETGPR